MLPKELIVQANPDLIIVPSWNSPGMQNTQNVQEVLEDPSLKGVTAVGPGVSKHCRGRYYIALITMWQTAWKRWRRQCIRICLNERVPESI